MKTNQKNVKSSTIPAVKSKNEETIKSVVPGKTIVPSVKPLVAEKEKAPKEDIQKELQEREHLHETKTPEAKTIQTKSRK
ncbi:MAG: hypothetical protein IPP38_06745 [Bacteroidetes bacterium]|nr:hypothetical protein [Bacteroidota bacterium]